jgi:hypothetical protein
MTRQGFVLLLCFGAASAAQPPEPSAPQQGPEAKVVTSSPTAQARAAVGAILERAQQTRTEAIDQLVAVVKANAQEEDLDFGAPKALAIEALGKLKAEESLPLLVGQIRYWASEIISADKMWDGMPAVGALIDVGLPSVIYLLRPAVLEAATAEELPRFAIVVRYVFPDAKTARAFVGAYDPGYSSEARAKHDELLKLLARSGTELQSLARAETEPGAKPSAPATQPAAPPASQPSSAPTGPQP